MFSLVLSARESDDKHCEDNYTKLKEGKIRSALYYFEIHFISESMT